MQKQQRHFSFAYSV